MLKICFLVIDGTSNMSDISQNRWKREKYLWSIYSKISNIDTYFLKCSSKNELIDDIVYCNCKEDLRPGIFQKTIVALEKLIDKYDIFVRTNLSTFFFENDFINLLKKYESSKIPIYLGSHIDQYYNGYQHKWAMGHTIILNKMSARILINHGKLSNRFNDEKTPDDALIALIFLSQNIPVQHTGVEIYTWKNNLSKEENINSIKSNEIPYLRIKFINNDGYNSLIEYVNNLSVTPYDSKVMNSKSCLYILLIVVIILTIVLLLIKKLI